LDIRANLVEHYSNLNTIISVMVLRAPVANAIHTLTHGFDYMVFVIMDDHPIISTSHYSKDGFRIQEHRMDSLYLEHAIFSGKQREWIQWLIQGEILLDKKLYLEDLRHRVLEYPSSLQEHKLFVEFTLFLKCYLKAKEYISQGHVLDAYCNVLEALVHWARITIIEQGAHPEITVWKQVYRINPGVYKLYEELTTSKETVAQRVELILLACDFSVMSKMEKCSQVLLRLLESRSEPWSYEELAQHADMAHSKPELGLLLNKLVKKLLIREVAVAKDNTMDWMELSYTR
jgi:hypothetical protein